MNIKVKPNETYKLDGIWEPDVKQLKRVEHVLSILPFNTTIYLLISSMFGSQYALKPKDTLILKPEHLKRKDVIIHEFGHHIWHKLLNNRQQQMWKHFVAKQGNDIFKRAEHDDIYNESLAHTAEYIWGKSSKRIKNIKKANLLADFLLLKILKKESKIQEGTYMKKLTKELQKRGYKYLAAKIQAQDEASPSLSDLQSAIIKLIKDNPNAKDAEVHNLAKQLGVEPDILEEATYKLLGDLIKGVGKHIDVPDKKYDPKQLAMGIKVEHEHTDNDAIAKEIAKDHLNESGLENYYTLLLAMEAKAKTAGVKEEE
jgi:hypothetical protein